MRNIFYISALLAITVSVGAGCLQRGPSGTGELVTYDTDMVNFTAPDTMKVEKKGPKLADIFTADQLVELSAQCGVNRDKNYFEDVLRNANDVTVEQYVITPKYGVSEPKSWMFTVVPNINNYTDEANLRKDFDNCNPGGQYYPDRVTDDNILFIAACTTSEEAAAKPQGCTDARGTVEATITLK